MKDLTVFVLTHNRGSLLLETINSVLNQTCSDFEFILSDNSSNNETYDLLLKNNLLGRLKYKKRDREYPSIDHFNMCLSEVETKYFMLFHDDDIMKPNMIERLYNAIYNSDYVAVASNAIQYINNMPSEFTFLTLGQDIIIKNQKQIVNAYITGQLAPYPSYMYSKEKLNDAIFTLEAGKYSDVTWLLRINKLGNFLWINEPLMYYRFHKNQDSSAVDFTAKSKMLKIFEKISKDEPRLLKNVKIARMGNLLSYANLHSHRISPFMVFHYQPKMLLLRSFVKKILPKRVVEIIKIIK